MTVTREIQLAVDKIHNDENALAAAAAANALQASQIADLQAKIAAVPVGTVLSDEDKKALMDAVNDVGDTNTALATAVPANVAPSAQPGPVVVPPAPLPDDPLAPRPDPIAGTGQSGTVPLMPNSAFDPAAGQAPAVGNPGQPNQPPAIATAGGFVVSGGGSVQRAPGSAPDSPSSTVDPAAATDPAVQEATAQQDALNQEQPPPVSASVAPAPALVPASPPAAAPAA